MHVHWTSFVFGWPFLAAVGLFGFGLLWRRPKLVLAASLLAAPMCLYLIGTPRFAGLAAVALLANGAAVWASARGRRVAATALLIPFAMLFVQVVSISAGP